MNDCLVICTADSERQAQAVKDHIDQVLAERGYHLSGLEGVQAGAWILMDYDDVVVHIFKREVREHYGLDRLWSDAKRVPLRPAAPAQAMSPEERRLGKERSVKQRRL